RRERMLGRQPIVENDRQITRFGKLHPQLAMGGWAAERPSAAVQVDDHRMWTGTLGHRYVGTKARAQLDVYGRQLLPSAALRNNLAGGIPGRQSTQNLTVVFAEHATYLPAFRKVLAHLLTLRRPSSSRAGRRRPPMK